ncbi:MAG: PAS domain-containing protein, partial [Desulfobacterales bacterium]|nr:PAS domain-containing protein [Desulfobacterales bacterium]
KGFSIQLNGSGKILYVENDAELVFNMEPKNLIGQSLFKFIHPDDRKYTRKTILKKTRQKKHWQKRIKFVNRYINTMGEILSVTWIASLVYSQNGELTLINCTAKDIKVLDVQQA